MPLKVGKKGVGIAFTRNVIEGIQLPENSLVSWSQIFLDQILNCNLPGLKCLIP